MFLDSEIKAFSFIRSPDIIKSWSEHTHTCRWAGGVGLLIFISKLLLLLGSDWRKWPCPAAAALLPLPSLALFVQAGSPGGTHLPDNVSGMSVPWVLLEVMPPDCQSRGGQAGWLAHEGDYNIITGDESLRTRWQFQQHVGLGSLGFRARMGSNMCALTYVLTGCLSVAPLVS
jgi:hypothetical protein